MKAGPSEADRRRGDQLQAEHLEFAFQKAEINDDAEGMKKAAEQYLELLGNQLTPKGSPMPGRGSFERDRDRIRQINESFRNRAPELSSLVRSRGFEIPSVSQMFERIRVRRARTRSRRR